MIPFKQIPANIRVPLFYAEVDNSHANTATLNQRALLIGQMISSGGHAGIATPNVPILCQGVADAKTQAGQGSILAQMADVYRQNDNFGEVWLLPLADDGAAVAAGGTLDFTAAATAAGTLCLYVGGVRVTMAVSSSQTTSQLATALAAAVNAINDLAVSAAVDGSVTHKVDFTAKNAGAAGNDIDIRVNYLGAAGGEVLPAGLAVTIVAMSGGATNPVLTTALANLMDQPFDFIAMPYTDTTSLNALRDFLGDTAGRWSWDVQVYGNFFTALRGTTGALAAAGTARNDQHGTVMGFNDSPSTNWNWAAAVAAQVAVSVRADPGVPVQTLPLLGILPPPLQSRFALSARNTLLFDGISTFTVDASGLVHLENVITTYQQNSFGQPDNSYLEVETMFLLMFVLRALASVVTTKYARVKLAADGTRFAPGSNIVTPSIIRADLIAQYKQLEFDGFVQQSDAFAKGLIVQQNSQNPNRVDVLWPGTLIDQLRIFALLAQFRLS